MVLGSSYLSTPWLSASVGTEAGWLQCFQLKNTDSALLEAWFLDEGLVSGSWVITMTASNTLFAVVSVCWLQTVISRTIQDQDERKRYGIVLNTPEMPGWPSSYEC